MYLPAAVIYNSADWNYKTFTRKGNMIISIHQGIGLGFNIGIFYLVSPEELLGWNALVFIVLSINIRHSNSEQNQHETYSFIANKILGVFLFYFLFLPLFVQTGFFKPIASHQSSTGKSGMNTVGGPIVVWCTFYGLVVN